jgi:hypothetical protein
MDVFGRPRIEYAEYPAEPDRLWVGYESDVGDTLDWVERRGYRHEPHMSDALDDIRLVREGSATLFFRPDVTLVWDGHTLTVEEY